ncbi:MAG: OmpA family protein [Deltaproteobacteria bacterium]|nr:OmpA family protein [Deltaproteobacteria bacterium]
MNTLMKIHFFFMTAAILLISVPTAKAIRPRGIDSQIYTPSTDYSGITGVESSTSLKPWTVNFGIGVNWAISPMRLDFSGAPDEESKNALSYQTTFDFLFTLGLPHSFSAFFRFPLHRMGPSDAFNENSDWGFTANDPLNTVDRTIPRSIPGDTTVGIKYGLFNNGKFSASLLGSVILPFGVEEVFGGDESIQARGTLSIGTTLKKLDAFLNLSYLYRPGHEIPDPLDDSHILLASSSELQFALGLRFRFTENVAVIGAVQQYIPVGCEDSCDKPFEMRAGVELLLTQSLHLQVFGGSGIPLVEDYGRGTDMRIGAALSWNAGIFEKKKVVGDRDSDGIKDDVDLCPDDKEDFDKFEDEDGCPEPDNDQDGIPDKLDKCPNEPEDEDGFQDSDGCPDPDNDGDNVLDSSDRCPGTDKDASDNFAKTREDRDGFEDEDGCPDPDNDQDGIPDAIDKCPNQKETVNGIDDTDGCPDAMGGPKMTGGQLTLKGKVRFEKRKSRFTRDSLGVLLSVANLLKSNPGLRLVRAEVHVGRTTSRRRDQNLSDSRAQAIRLYLLGKGVPPWQIQAVGYGSSYPVMKGTSKKAEKANNRVDFIIVYQ